MAEICKHDRFGVTANITKLKEEEDSEVIKGYRMDATVKCLDCGSLFAFVGLPGGYDPSFPTVNADKTEIRCPLEISF